MLSQALILIAASVFDAFVSYGHTAFLHSNLALLGEMSEEDHEGSTLAIRIKEDSTRLLLTFRVAKSVARLLILWAGTALIFQWIADEQMGIQLVLSLGLLASALLLLLIDLLMEILSRDAPEQGAFRFAPFVAMLIFIFTPITWLLGKIAGPLTKGGQDRQHLITEEEIMTLVDAGEEEGVIEEDEKAMIFSIFQLGDTLCREVMVPRIDILAFREDTTLQEAADRLLETGYSRAPIYSGTIDNVIGLLYVKDLLSAWQRDNREQTVTGLLRDAFFVPEAKKVDDLLAEMQAKRVHMAVVVDEYGGTAGVVTIEDIVEEIVGEIRDEYDFAEEVAYEQLQEGEYMFSGGIDLDDVNQITGAYLPTDNTETLAGFVYSQLGKVPVQGEFVEAGGLHLVVANVAGRRIRKIRATRVDEPERELNKDGNHNRSA